MPRFGAYTQQTEFTGDELVVLRKEVGTTTHATLDDLSGFLGGSTLVEPTVALAQDGDVSATVSVRQVTIVAVDGGYWVHGQIEVAAAEAGGTGVINVVMTGLPEPSSDVIGNYRASNDAGDWYVGSVGGEWQDGDVVVWFLDYDPSDHSIEDLSYTLTTDDWFTFTFSYFAVTPPPM